MQERGGAIFQTYVIERVTSCEYIFDNKEQAQ
jgi:hypothetical protein